MTLKPKSGKIRLRFYALERGRRVKFNEQDGVILISDKEIVKTAQRGICTHIPLDEDSPSVSSASIYTKKQLIGDKRTEKIE